jgi:hypothetical protein
MGLPPAVRLSGTPSGDMRRLAYNMEKEMPHALNIGMNSSDPAGTLQNFTLYSQGAALSKGIDMDCLWVAFVPAKSGLNVTAGNFMDSYETVGINVSGTYKELYVPNGTRNSTTFGVSSYSFNVTVSHSGAAGSATMLTNKTSLYSFVSLERGENVVRKEIYA